MRAIIENANISGTVKLPSSKSLTHRALICAMLADSVSTIYNVTYSDDVLSTISCIKALGAQVKSEEDKIIVTGINNTFNQIIINELDANESASTLRFFIPLVSLTGKEITIKGKESLFKRPLDIYNNIIQKYSNKVIVNKKIEAKEYKIKGDISSQFISGLMFSLPLLENDSYITVQEPFESSSYVYMTIAILKEFGINIKVINKNKFFIKGKQKYKSEDYYLEKDFSQAAFYIALGMFYPLVIPNLNRSSIQGDKAILDIIKSLNGKFYFNNNDLITEQSELIKGTIDIKDCPDLGPILMALVSFIKGSTKIINVKRLKYKESNRIISMQEELKKFNVSMYVMDNEILIEGGNSLFSGEELVCHNDHRVCMALVLMGLIVQEDVIIDGIECINKSYPSFFDDLKKLGAKIIIE